MVDDSWHAPKCHSLTTGRSAGTLWGAIAQDYANASCTEKGGLWTLADVFAERLVGAWMEVPKTLPS